MLDFLLDAVGDGPATYLALVGIVLIDDFVPFAPGDTAMITAGILASNGGLSLVLVIAAGALGGILGDNLFYLLGRRFGPRLAGMMLRGGRSAEAYRWAERQLDSRGSTVILVGRFIPGGRAVTTFASGTVSFPYRRFLAVDALAATAWASYTALLGYAGGETFKDSLWKPLLIGLGVAFLLGSLAEARRRRSERESSPSR
jgi:membrane-associated protein